jgi:hypothetical protein
MILLIPPSMNAGQEVRKSLARNGLTQAEEIEPKAGCRRFRLS